MSFGFRSCSVLLMFVLMSVLSAQEPDIIVLTEADTYISGRNNGNYIHGHPDSTAVNDYTMLVIKNEGEPVAGNSFYREAYLRFDLSSVEQPIERVELKLWSVAKADTIDWAAYEDTLTFGCYLVEGDDWDETTMTWNLAPIPTFDFPLEVQPLMWYDAQTGEEDGLLYHYYGWNQAGELDASVVEAERTGDGKISMNVYGKQAKVWGETEKTWFAAVSKDSAQIAERDIEPRLWIWVEGGGSAVAAQPTVPQEFQLGANYPNPFNPSTTIHYTLAASAPTRLTIYNALGQAVYTRQDVPSTPGHHTVQWNGQTDGGQFAPSGLYFYQLESGEHQATRKMILMQ